jgi:hypothetical protein
MNANVGNADRLIRLVLAALAAVIAVSVGASSGLGLLLLVVAGVLVVTAAVGFCPLYRLVGKSTCPAEAH